MPTLLPVNTVARCVLAGVADSVPIINVFHVQKDPVGGAFTQGELDNLANNFATILKTRLAGLIANAYTFQSLTCTDLSTSFGVVSVVAMTGAGTAGASPLPNSACIGLSWKVAKHYRGGHPRSYIGPMSNTNMTGSTSISAAAVTAAKTAGAGIISDVRAIAGSGAPFNLVAVHRNQGGAVLSPPGISTILSVGVDTRIDTQRRRLGKDRVG